MKYLYLFILLIIIQAASAQSKLLVIKASSTNVSINDGGYFSKDSWRLSPKVKPDIFTADRARRTKWVTFYTDIDSIRVKVKPGTKYNFIILLNGKESCYTQIVSAIMPQSKSKNTEETHDTIPFSLTSFNAIQVKAVINDTDTLNLHFDASSFDFRLTKAALLKKTKLLSNQADALSGKANPDYNHLNKVFKLQIGTLTFNNPDIFPTSVTAHDMDGRFGYNIFEGKQVEIDYDHSVMIVHSKLLKISKAYVKSKMEFIRSFGYIKGTFYINSKKYTGNFIMDTGSDQAIILDSTWVSQQNFSKSLKLIKLTVLRDPRGVKYETKTVLSPLFKIDNFQLTDIPTLILSGKNPLGFEINYLGNDLLKRFNIILDFKNDYLYLKPNSLMNLKYKGNS
ncbi:hypothetical protein JN11_03221 [Mucilaginibacter frigoritolerans]|uniref:Aspartyl protease n=1 Tax=Mucilaginibacter frigoritolerans TaxID=652788 RepID=A0A562TX30_9SPHI|nr:hypothetical protein [Mucilaginibacter frigoritolerans]TWI98142.1 hypothetical protein JN11_03221 [Mucilaginibacter frigoritolerans]